MAELDIRTLTLPSGQVVPVLGQGTWRLGEHPSRRADEIAALRLGLDLGMTLLDTAEMYGDGATEELVGEAIAGRRDEVFLVSKVLPSNATTQKTIAACERSLKRLRTDCLDLYLLHWRGSVRLEETLEAFSLLRERGKIRAWGVSNFDHSDMVELVSTAGGADVQTNQVLYNLTRRGVEWDLMPWAQRSNVPLMAYSPIEQGRLSSNPTLREIAQRHQATPAQIALAWVLRIDSNIVIPKAGTTAHVRENRAALDIRLSTQDLDALDRAFPPPSEPRPLEML